MINTALRIAKTAFGTMLKILVDCTKNDMLWSKWNWYLSYHNWMIIWLVCDGWSDLLSIINMTKFYKWFIKNIYLNINNLMIDTIAKNRNTKTRFC